MPKDFKKQLRKLGLSNGDVVFMHSSMKALNTDKTPEEFINDVISVIGREGTLLIPAFTWSNVNEEQPHFSARETEPCDGLIPRRFLRMPGVVRSLHPTHSVGAFGKLAMKLISKHALDETPQGPNSPLTRLPEFNGKILFIGDILHSCSFMHSVEEIAQVPYVLAKKRVRYTIEDENGAAVEKEMIPHDFHGWGAEYGRVKKILKYPDIKKGKVGKAKCFLVDAAALLEKAIAVMKREPYYFVTDISKYI